MSFLLFLLLRYRAFPDFLGKRTTFLSAIYKIKRDILTCTISKLAEIFVFGDTRNDNRVFNSVFAFTVILKTFDNLIF